MSDNLGVARGSVEINTSSLKNADIALRSAGTSMLNFGMQAIRAFGSIVGAAAEFQKEMDFVQAVTSASSDEMKKLNDAAFDLSKKSIFGPIELAKAFVDLAKAGASTQQIIEGVGEASIALAQAADVKIPFAGENLINILNTFQLGAEQAMHAADLLAGAANASSVDLNDLVISMKYAGPVAAGLGITLEDVTDSLTLLGKVGIRGSTAGTALRMIMLRLGENSGVAGDALKKLGIITADGKNQFFDAAGEAKSLAEVFEILGKSTKDMTSEAKVQILNDLFGQRAIPAALELLKQGEAGYRAINEEISRTTAADVAAKRLDNLSGSVKRLKATLEAMFVEAGGPFQKFLKGVVDGLRSFLLWIDKLPGPLKTGVVATIGIIGVLSILSGVFLLTIGNMVRAVRVMSEVINGIRVITGLFRGATVATQAMTAATQASNGAFLASPVGWVVIAIVALVAAITVLYFKVGAVRRFIDNLWQSMQKLWDVLLGGLRGALKATVNWFKDLPGHVSAAYRAVVEFFTGLPGLIGRAIQTAVTSTTRVLGELASRATRAFDAVVDSIGGLVSSALSAIGQAVARVPSLLAKALGTLGSALVAALKKIPYWVGYAIGFIVGSFVRLQLEVLKVFVKLVVAIVKVLLKLPGQIVRVLFFITKTFVEWGAKLTALLVRAMIRLVGLVLQELRKLPGQVLAIFGAILSFIMAWGPQLLSFLAQLFLDIVTGIMATLWSLPGQVWGVFTSILSGLSGFIGSFFGVASSMGSALWRGMIDAIAGMPDKVWSIMQAVWNKIKEWGGKFYNVAKGVFGGIWSGFKDALGIHSPSFLEKAMYSIQDESRNTLTQLQSAVGKLQGYGNRLPTIMPAAIGLATPQAAATATLSTGYQYNQNAPLIGQATIRDERDITQLARELHKLQQGQLAARGRREVTR